MKGQKTGGRTKGTPNRTTKAMRNFVMDVLANNKSTIKEDLKRLEPHERIRALFSLLPYVCPRMQVQQVAINDMTGEELDALAKTLFNLTEDSEE